jgi:hypothetical protein
MLLLLDDGGLPTKVFVYETKFAFRLPDLLRSTTAGKEEMGGISN